MNKAQIKSIIENYGQLLETISNGCENINKIFRASIIEDAKSLRNKCISLRQGMKPIDFRNSYEVSSTVKEEYYTMLSGYEYEYKRAIEYLSETEMVSRLNELIDADILKREIKLAQQFIKRDITDIPPFTLKKEGNDFNGELIMGNYRIQVKTRLVAGTIKVCRHIRQNIYFKRAA